MSGPAQRIGVAYRAVAGVVRPVLFALMKRDWRGADRLPPEGTGFVAVANHISHVDFLTFAHFLWDNKRAPRFLAKASLFRIPLIGRIITACGQIPVYRESRDAAKAYRAALEAVKAGECVAIYPEGTITRDPGLWPMTGRTGAARVALETGCDVIPVAQWGPEEILAPYSKRIRLLPRKLIRVVAGPPVDLDEFRDKPLTKDVMTAATTRIMDAITDQLAALRNELPPPERFNPRAAGVPTTGDPKQHRGTSHTDGTKPSETEA